jgi:hypothetical protein
MSVVRAKIQTVEDIYRLVWAAVGGKRPIRATYHGRDRWFCPHRLGRNHEGQVRVLFRCFLGPFNQKPFFRARFGAFFIAMSRTHTHSGKTGSQGSLTTRPPTDVLPSRRRQTQSQLLHRNRLMIGVALQARGGGSTTRLSRRRRQRLFPWFPNTRGRLDTS